MLESINLQATLESQTLFQVQYTKWKTSIGRLGEHVAAQSLSRSGFNVEATNWRFGRTPEIDIIASSGAILMIVEVRSRVSSSLDEAELDLLLSSVDASKQRRLSIAARAYMTSKRRFQERQDADQSARFDVVACLIRKPEVIRDCRPPLLSVSGDNLRILHVPGAFF